MRIFIILLFAFFLVQNCKAQPEGKWLRGFPITGYMVDLDDSTKLVQLEMPEGFRIPDKELAIAYGIYKTSKAEAVQKGYGRCHLVKGVYHYFSIGNNRSGILLNEGDLLYMFLDTTGIYYGRFPKLASHFIRLQDVYEKPFYDRYHIFSKWSALDEQILLDSLLNDIHFTGAWLNENEPSGDQRIEAGRYKGKTVYEVMTGCREKDLTDFLDYVIDNPRIYAGCTWKITEIFATWATVVQSGH